MICSSWVCGEVKRPGPCAEEDYDVLVVGAGIGGLAAAQELSRYGLKVAVYSEGPKGGHNALDGEPTISGAPAREYIDKYAVEVNRGIFDGEVLISGGRCVKPRYRHLVLSTGGVEMYTPMPGSRQVLLASEALASGINGRKLLVWGTTEWGLRTAMALARRGNQVAVADNSAYLRDVKYYQGVRSALEKLGIEVVHSATIRRYRDGVVELKAYMGKRGVETKRIEADAVVSAVRTANLYAPLRLGLKVFYSFELNSLVPRRNGFGEVLRLDERGKSAGGTNIYTVGELYGAIYAHIEEAHGRLLASYIASKEGLEDADRAAKALEEFRAKIALEANWLYNLDLRLSRGTDYSDLYVEPNVIDAPGWPYFWPNDLDEIDGDQIICPCSGLKLSDLMRAVDRLNKSRVEVRVTSDEVNRLRHVKLPTVDQMAGGPSPCFEVFCIPNIAIIAGAIYAQKPSYLLYGRPKQLYEPTS
jgi:NADPH-dependent 2,4-dienoyl-CoA reductase/sulfur reductase-like enzyme